MSDAQTWKPDVRTPPPPPTQWSEMSTHQLLDEAQVMFERDEPQAAMALIAAAQVQATESLAWVFENRIGPTLGQAIWEGMRQR